MAGAGGAAGFAAGYVVLRVLLLALYGRARHHVDGQGHRLADIYLAGYSCTTGLWLLSIFVPGRFRYVLWCAAMLIDLAIPVRAWGALKGRAVVISHLTERFGTFFIIVLGEAVVSVVAGVAGLEFTVECWIVGVCVSWWRCACGGSTSTWPIRRWSAAARSGWCSSIATSPCWPAWRRSARAPSSRPHLPGPDRTRRGGDHTGRGRGRYCAIGVRRARVRRRAGSGLARGVDAPGRGSERLRTDRSHIGGGSPVPADVPAGTFSRPRAPYRKEEQ